MKSNFNFQGKYERDILNFVTEYAASPLIAPHLKIYPYDFKEAFIKACIGALPNSKRFRDFINDFYSDNLKKYYFFSSKEEIDIANIFICSKKKRITFFFEKKFNYYFKIYLFKLLI